MNNNTTRQITIRFVALLLVGYCAQAALANDSSVSYQIEYAGKGTATGRMITVDSIIYEFVTMKQSPHGWVSLVSFMRPRGTPSQIPDTVDLEWQLEHHDVLPDPRKLSAPHYITQPSQVVSVTSGCCLPLVQMFLEGTMSERGQSVRLGSREPVRSLLYSMSGGSPRCHDARA